MNKERKKIGYKAFVHIGLILLIWQIVYMMEVVPKSALPSIADVMKEFVEVAQDGIIFIQAMASMSIVIQGLIISFILAVLVVYISLVSQKANDLLETITTLLNPLPGIALLPLIMIWFGVGEGAILAIIIHSVLWPLILNFKVGFSTLPKTYRKVALNLELTPYELMKDVLLPSSIPYILSGLQIGWSRAWRTLISTEMIFGTVGSQGGLGRFIYQQRAFANIPGIFVGIFIIMIIGLTVEQGLFKRANDYVQKRWEQ